MTKKHLSLLVVFVMLFTSLFSSFAFAAEEEMVLADDITINVDYHVQSYGDRKATGDGAVFFGTEGESKRLEKFKITLEGAPADMELVANGHVQTYGDMPEDGSFTTDAIGTTAEAKRLEGLGLKLVKKGTDELYPGYSIQYQVHMRWYGWGANADQNWRKGNADAFAADGEYAGTKGEGLRLEGVSIRILKEAKLAVKEVSADNLKTITFEFNKEIDEDTLGKVKAKDAKAYLLEDEKTVAVVFDTKAAQGAKVKVEIDGLKSVDGDVLEDYVWEERVFDTDVPVMVGAAVLNNKQIELFFNEPVDFTRGYYTVLSDIKLDGVAVIAKPTADPLTNSVILEFPSLLKNGEQELSVAGIKDFAGLEMDSYKTDIVVVEDKNAPVMTGVEVKNIKEVHVTFDEKLASIGEYWVNGTKANAEYVDDSKGTVVKLTGFTLDLSSVVELRVEYKGQKDVVGNEVKETKSFSTRIEDDTELPTVALEVKAGNQIVLTFSKSMLTDEGTVSVLNKEAKVHKAAFDIDGKGTWETNNTVLKLNASELELGGVNPDQYTLVLKGFKDATVRKNLLPEQKITFNALDTLKPNVADSYTVETKDSVSKITIYFTEAMDKDSAENWSNYSYDSKSLALRTDEIESVKLASDGKSVVITYKKNKPATDKDITVSAVKDLAGNMIEDGFQTVSIIDDADRKMIVSKVTAIDVDVLEVEFSHEVYAVDPGVFAVAERDNLNVHVANFISASIDGKKVTFVANKDLGTDPGAAYKLVVLAKDALVNVYGGELGDDYDTIGISIGFDKVAPKIAKVTSTTAGAIEIEFSENVKVDVTSPTDADLLNDLIIRDEDGDIVSGATITVDGDYTNFAKVTISGLEAGDYTVELISRNVKDVNNSNIVKAFAAKEIEVK